MTEQITPEKIEDLLEWLEEGNIGFADIAAWMTVSTKDSVFDELRAMKEWCDTNAKSFLDRAKAQQIEAKKYSTISDQIKDWINDCLMEEKDENGNVKTGVKIGLNTKSYLKNSPPKLVIDDENMIPFKYVVPSITIKNELVKNDLVTGVPVPGAHIEVGKTLMLS